MHCQSARPDFGLDPRPLFGGLSTVVLLATTALYIAIAEIAKFDLLGLRLPGYPRIAHRMREAAILWIVMCTLYGFAMVATKRVYHRRVSALVPASVPIIVGVCLSLYELWRFIHMKANAVRHANDVLVDLLGSVVPCVSVILPVAMGSLAGYVLVLQCRLWRRFTAEDTRCRKCDYDLTGNVSGTCPECGSPIP